MKNAQEMNFGHANRIAIIRKLVYVSNIFYDPVIRMRGD